ncbi:MAG: response regulator [Actinobacteria bacterium]|nr:response regulator [Actinomycetota bacterium]
MKRVLVVDDAVFMRTMIKDILTRNGFTVVGEAATGVEAVDKYNYLKPDLVTMDITMPEMDGISALKIILENDVDARVVMVSAMGQEKLIFEALGAGAVDFITKPFQPNKIIKTLTNSLNK